MTPTIKAGDLVRVPGWTSSRLCYGHGLPQGAVCIVTEGPDRDGDFEVRHPSESFGQLVHGSVLKPAKQAMAEREALRLLNAGNIPKPQNKSPVANRMRKHMQAYANRRG